MDLAAVAGEVALIAGGAAVEGLAQAVTKSLVEKIRERIRSVFGGDPRSVDALEQAMATPENQNAIKELARALCWYAERDPRFAEELAGWAPDKTSVGTAVQASPGTVVQNGNARGNLFMAAGNMTVDQSKAKSSPDG